MPPLSCEWTEGRARGGGAIEGGAQWLAIVGAEEEEPRGEPMGERRRSPEGVLTRKKIGHTLTLSRKDHVATQIRQEPKPSARNKENRAL
jgi:hypothetical protein